MGGRLTTVVTVCRFPWNSVLAHSLVGLRPVPWVVWTSLWGGRGAREMARVGACRRWPSAWSPGALCGPVSALPHLARPGVGAHGRLLTQMPRRGGGGGDRRNRNASSCGTARPPRACPQPCRCPHHRCRLPPPRPPQRPRHPLSTLCPGSLAPSLRCPAHRSVVRGGAASAPCSEAPQ